MDRTVNGNTASDLLVTGGRAPGGRNQGRTRDATNEEVHREADHREAAWGRGRVGL